MEKKILITGVTGFVGSHFADYLSKNVKNLKIYGTKRYHLSRLDNIKHLIKKDEIELLDCDLTDPISVRNLISKLKPEVILHFAAESFVSPSWEHPNRYMSVNYNATVNILDSIKEFCPKSKILIPGSGEEYGEINKNELPINPETILRPVNPYAVTKIAQDLIGYVYFKSYDLQVIRTRTFNHEGQRREYVFGIPWYAYQISKIENGLQEPVVKVGHIDDKRNFTHVKDVVEAYWLAVNFCEPGELYLIGSDEAGAVFTFRQALEMLISKSSVNNIEYVQDKKYTRPTNVPFLISNTEKFRKLTGWTPRITFDQILDDTLEFWRDRISKEGV
mgnify:FL=1